MKRLFDKVTELVLTLRTQSDRRKLMNGLQQQRFLLRTGMQATADVVEIQKKGIRINNLVEIKFVLGIHKPNGQMMLAESYSIVNIDKIPLPGQKLKIWFIPQDTSYILIL
jgi:hypothetical protein